MNPRFLNFSLPSETKTLISVFKLKLNANPKITNLMKTRISNPYLVSLICPLVLAVAVLPAAAAPIYWDGTGTNLGSWDDLDNWSTDPGNSTSSPSLKPGNLDDVFFNVTSANASNQVIHLNGLAQAAKSLTFNSTGTTDLNNASTPSATATNLSLGNGGLTVSANVGAVRIGGTVSASNGATVVLTDSATFTHNGASSLSYGRAITTAPSLGAKTLILAGAGVSEYNGINQASVTSLTLQVDAGHHSFRAGSGLTAVTINGGTIYSRGSTQFGTTTPITFNGGTFAAVGSARSYPNPISIGGNFQLGVAAVPATIGDIAIAAANNATLSGAVDLNDAIRTITIGGNTQTISGVISSTTAASGGITVTGTAGVLVLSNTNTYTGLTTVSGSTLRLGNLAGDTLSGDITVSGGTLNVDNPDTVGAVTLTSGTISGDSALTGTSYSVASGTISSALAGSGALTKTTNGTVTLSGNNSAYTGISTVSAGTLLATNATALPGYNVNDAVVFNGGTVGAVIGTSPTNWSTAEVDTLLTKATKTAGALGIDTTNGNLTQWTAFTTSNFGALGLNKLGANTLTLDQANTYTGPTTITAGILSISAANNLGDAASNLVFDGGTLQVTGTTLNSLASLGRTNPVVFNSGKSVSLDVADSSNTFTVGQDLNQGTGGFTKLGAGTVVLNQTNTYTGLTTVSAGTLTLAHPTDTLTGDITVNGGTLNVQNPDTVGTVTLISGTISGASALAAGNGYAVQSGTFSSPLGGSGSLTKTTGGTVTLSGLSTTASNNYSGTTILGGGTLSITQDASFAGGLTFGATANENVANTLNLDSASATFAGTMFAQTNTALNTITIGSDQKLTINGNVSFTAPGQGSYTRLTLSGSGGWDVISSNGTFGGISAQNGNRMEVDMSGLAEFNANLRTGGAGSDGGVFRVGGLGGSTNARANLVSLATNSTISADSVTLGGAGQTSTHTLSLGNGSQTINSDSIVLGTGIRDTNSTINFRTADGTLKIRGTDGGNSTRSNLTVFQGTNTGAISSALFDVTGHQVDLLFNTLAVFNSTAGTGQTYTGTFSFDRGDLDATTLQIGRKATGALNHVGTGVVNIGNSTTNHPNTSTLGAVNMGIFSTADVATAGSLNSTLNITGASTAVDFATMSMANSTSADVDANVVSAANISGGTVTGTSGINMLEALTAGTATSALTISGGSLSVGTSSVSATNGIYRTAATGTTTLELDGGSLNLNGNAIGEAGANAIATQFESGTLSNVGEINGGAGLTKTTPGTLTLTGTNTYTGTTAVNEGTLSMSSPSLANASAVTIATGAVLNLNYVGTDTVASLTLGATTHTTGTFNSANSGGLITGTGQLTVGSATTPYATWVALYPGFTNNLPGQDQDGDGLINQREFAFGLNPTSGSSVNPITVGLAPATGNFSYTRNANSVLTYKVWSSTDLAVWTERTGATQTPVGIPDSFGTQTVNVTTLGATAVGGKLFVRVTAE